MQDLGMGNNTVDSGVENKSRDDAFLADPQHLPSPRLGPFYSWEELNDYA